MNVRKSLEGDRLNIRRGRTRGGVRVIRAGHIKGDILRDHHPMSNMIIVVITLILGVIPIHTQLTKQSAWCAHEEGEEHSKHARNEGGDYSVEDDKRRS